MDATINVVGCIAFEERKDGVTVCLIRLQLTLEGLSRKAIEWRGSEEEI